MIKLKITTLGSSHSGKTSFANCTIRQKFNPRFNQTIGADFQILKYTNGPTQFNIQLWQFAGGQRFIDTIAQNYYRNMDAFILMFSTASKHSFDQIQRQLLVIQKIKPAHAMVFFVGNKVDLRKQREVPREEAEMVALKYGSFYWECSCKEPELGDPLEVVKRIVEEMPVEEIMRVRKQLDKQTPVLPAQPPQPPVSKFQKFLNTVKNFFS